MACSGWRPVLVEGDHGEADRRPGQRFVAIQPAVAHRRQPAPASELPMSRTAKSAFGSTRVTVADSHAPRVVPRATSQAEPT